MLLPGFYLCFLQRSAMAQTVRNPIFVKKDPEQQLTLLSKQAHTPLLATKTARKLALVYCSSVECILEQTAFQKAGLSGSLKGFNADFFYYPCFHFPTQHCIPAQKTCQHS